MSYRKTINGANGVLSYLGKFQLGTPKNKSYSEKDKLINSVLVKYLKEAEKVYFKKTPVRYKGIYTALNRNCSEVQKSFRPFRRWIESNYIKV